jgi:hypothetical protein
MFFIYELILQSSEENPGIPSAAEIFGTNNDDLVYCCLFNAIILRESLITFL